MKQTFLATLWAASLTPALSLSLSSPVFADSYGHNHRGHHHQGKHNNHVVRDVHDEASLQTAIAEANLDSSIKTIIFRRNANINLTSPVVYTGSQSLRLRGQGATINGESAGSFVLDEDLTAITEDGTLVFNTEGDISISHLNVKNSSTRGIVVNLDEDTERKNINVHLHQVNVTNSALYGVHIDDNTDAFDDGENGSAAGINLLITFSSFTGNGTGAIDFDGVRVDERGKGSINANIYKTHIDQNGGDGIELDEGGDGHVRADMRHVSLNDNGFFNEEDLDDGFDIDEAGNGNIKVSLSHVEVNGNMDEGLDFDEEGAGSVRVKLRDVMASNNSDEALKVDEEDAGDIRGSLKRVSAIGSGDDGIQFTELGEGLINLNLKNVLAQDNGKYGIKAEQWVVEDEEAPIEEAGKIKIKNVTLSGNDKGDEIKVNNIEIIE